MFTWLIGSASHPPSLVHLRSSRTFVLSTVSTAIFTDIFVYGIIVPVVPFALTTRASIDPSQIQRWISILLAVYGAALLAAAPFCGWLADRWSNRRMPLLLGLLALGASTVLLCVGNSIGILIVGRALQGVSAAVVWVVGLALLVDTVGPDEIGQVMGYVGLSMSLAILVAPLLAGVVFQTAGYYSVFAMAFGLIVLDIIMRLVMIEKKVAATWVPSADIAKQPANSKGNRQSRATIELEEGNQSKLQDWQEVVSQRVNPESATGLTASEGSVTQPARGKWSSKLPPVITLLASRRLFSALWACLIQASLFSAFDSILPLFVKNIFHWNSIGAGLIFLPVVVASFLGPIVGWLSDRHGPRWYATAGFIASCPFLILLRLVDHNSLDQKVLLCALLGLIGITLTLVLTPMMAEITYATEAKTKRHPPSFFGKNGAYAQAYSLFNMAWAGGCLVGPLLAGLVNQAHGWGTATLILGVVSVVTAIPTVVWTGGSIWKKRRRQKDAREEGICPEPSG